MAREDMANQFWEAAEKLVATSEIKIDRPKGSTHPTFPSIVYPLSYGYLEGTGAVDGAGVDVWVGDEPGKRVVGILTTVDLFKRDSEIKLLLGCTEEDIQLALNASNTGSQSAMLIRRNEL